MSTTAPKASGNAVSERSLESIQASGGPQFPLDGLLTEAKRSERTVALPRSASAGGAGPSQGPDWIDKTQPQSLPRPRGPAAPVTDGTLPGWPNSVSLASTAKAIASLASGSTPSDALVATGTGASSCERCPMS